MRTATSQPATLPMPRPRNCNCEFVRSAVAAAQRSSMTETYDAIIIGTGEAGPFLAQRLAAAGMKVAILERKLFGGVLTPAAYPARL